MDIRLRITCNRAQQGGCGVKNNSNVIFIPPSPITISKSNINLDNMP